MKSSLVHVSKVLNIDIMRPVQGLPSKHSNKNIYTLQPQLTNWRKRFYFVSEVPKFRNLPFLWSFFADSQYLMITREVFDLNEIWALWFFTLI